MTVVIYTYVLVHERGDQDLISFYEKTLYLKIAGLVRIYIYVCTYICQ